jgi:hypothetical protein
MLPNPSFNRTYANGAARRLIQTTMTSSFVKSSFIQVSRDEDSPLFDWQRDLPTKIIAKQWGQISDFPGILMTWPPTCVDREVAQ